MEYSDSFMSQLLGLCVLTCYLRSVVLVALAENLGVVDEGFVAGQDPEHPRDPRLQQPHELVEVVQRDFQRLGGHEH